MNLLLERLYGTVSLASKQLAWHLSGQHHIIASWYWPNKDDEQPIKQQNKHTIPWYAHHIATVQDLGVPEFFLGQTVSNFSNYLYKKKGGDIQCVAETDLTERSTNPPVKDLVAPWCIFALAQARTHSRGVRNTYIGGNSWGPATGKEGL